LGLLNHAKFCKNRLRGYTSFGQIYTTNTNFGDLGAVDPYFKPQRFLSHNGEIWHEDADPGVPPQTKFCKSRLRGYTPSGQRGLSVLHCPAVMYIDF